MRGAGEAGHGQRRRRNARNRSGPGTVPRERLWRDRPTPAPKGHGPQDAGQNSQAKGPRGENRASVRGLGLRRIRDTVTVADTPFFANGKSFTDVTIIIKGHVSPGKSLTVTTSLGVLNRAAAAGQERTLTARPGGSSSPTRTSRAPVRISAR